jgi:hypothetical protein
MKMAAYQLAILLVLIVTDAGSAIYDRYFTDKQHSVRV